MMDLVASFPVLCLNSSVEKSENPKNQKSSKTPKNVGVSSGAQVSPCTIGHNLASLDSNKALGGPKWTEEVEDNGSDLWSDCVVGYFLDKKVAFPIVKNIEGAHCKVMESGPWPIAGNLMILKKWRPQMVLQKEQMSSIPICVHFSNVPLEFWNAEGLIYIASAIGEPLYADDKTETGKCVFGHSEASHKDVAAPKGVGLSSAATDPFIVEDQVVEVIEFPVHSKESAQAPVPSKISSIPVPVSCPMEQGVVASANRTIPHSPVKANVGSSGRIGQVSPAKAGSLTSTSTEIFVGSKGSLKDGVMEPVSMSKSPLLRVNPSLSNTFAILDSTCHLECGIVNGVLSSQEDDSSSSAKTPVVKKPRGKGKGDKAVWSIRGLNNPLKQKEVFSFIQSQQLCMMGVVETKIRREHLDAAVCKCFPSHWLHTTNLDTSGSTARIIMAWDPGVSTVTIISASSQMVLGKVEGIACRREFFISVL
ncbi:hypothetical protein RHSIM_Rhsim04G0128800 [Rhododendron simsii]|uniref:DUF4283 domain-containing protein n=1 Tax=Rhododendron simsii TaxID=118357 RepID=A0A834H0Q1_RHOSS|nr:hypothetical protein RHSIM_Rhsim04G0128800 [Rhododendron simsii]